MLTGWLLKRFVRNNQDTGNQTVRTAYATLGTTAGICINVALSLTKFLVGLLSGSVAVTADAANNLSDAGGSIVSLVSARMAQKPGDRDHPFGHGRMEYIGALGVGIFILLMGFELLKGGIDNIITPSTPDFTLITFIIMIGSVLTKGWLYFFYMKLGKAIDSQPLKAASKDSVSDVLATSGVLIGMLIDRLFGIRLDGYMGVLVSLFVLKTGYGVCKETVDRLLGAKPSQEINGKLTDRLLSYEEILGVHDLVVHDYGPGRSIASVHAEVSAKADIVKIHEVIDLAERDISKEMNIPLVIHMDPIVTDDGETLNIIAKMESYLVSVDPRLKLHDFRRVMRSDRITLLFDVVVPSDWKDKDGLREKIEDYARELDSKNECVLHFDPDYYQ
jgi:cation diffusion facilitator family transporter